MLGVLVRFSALSKVTLGLKLLGNSSDYNQKGGKPDTAPSGADYVGSDEVIINLLPL